MAPVFDSQSRSRIQTWNQTLEVPVTIQCLQTGHPEDSRWTVLQKEIKALAPRLMIEIKEKDDGLPGFLVNDNITFSALPLERELTPFLDLLTQLAGNAPHLSPGLQERLKKLDVPVRLTLFIALACPHCPGMVRALVPLALSNPNMSLHIIDGSLFPDQAQNAGVMSAPCLILDDDFRWTGSVTQQEIVSVATGRDPSALSADTLKNILEQGDASWITKKMMEKKALFDGFIKLLLHDTWSVRLGAMVVVEELAEQAPELAAELCPPLIRSFDQSNIPVQGDILYALGEAGTQKTAEWIREQMPKLSHPDLADAAKEALETLEERNG